MIGASIGDIVGSRFDFEELLAQNLTQRHRDTEAQRDKTSESLSLRASVIKKTGNDGGRIVDASLPKFRPFHVYSMKQAIEEGFILDVLKGYTTYQSYYRIRKTIKAMTPQERHGDLDVYCLRNAEIDTDEDDNKRISRFDFIKHSIEQDHPDLVIIDGIADLIYNYNDVIESQDVVNKLASLASHHNCCIVVVMHQNKGRQDKNMKGHLGTMLFQKCSDVFNVDKCGSVFVASHAVSRHRNCEDICFKLDANAVPMDAVADRQLQVEMKRQANKATLFNQISLCMHDDTAALKRSEIVKSIKEELGYGNKKSYDLFNEAVKVGILKTNDNRHYTLVPQ